MSNSVRVAVVAGSHRTTGQSGRVARYVCAQLEQRADVEPWLFDLAGNPLPLWEQGVWDGDAPWPAVWTPVARQLQSSDALVLVSPEWGGMVPPGVKNFLLLCGNAELAHKPGLAIGVSSGAGGAYPLAELRVSGTKNNHLVWIPEQLALRAVGDLLVGSEPVSPADAEVRDRLDYALGVLLAYAGALRKVRTDPRIDVDRYPFGM